MIMDRFGHAAFPVIGSYDNVSGIHDGSGAHRRKSQMPPTMGDRPWPRFSGSQAAQEQDPGLHAHTAKGRDHARSTSHQHRTAPGLIPPRLRNDTPLPGCPAPYADAVSGRRSGVSTSNAASAGSGLAFPRSGARMHASLTLFPGHHRKPAPRLQRRPSAGPAPHKRDRGSAMPASAGRALHRSGAMPDDGNPTARTATLRPRA